MQELKITNSNGVEVYLYGEIGRYMDVDVNYIVRDLERLQKEKNITSITFYVNSGGGDVMQGLALYNYLNRCNLDVTWVVDGIAASMMAMLMCNPKHKVKAAKYAKLMYHRVTGYVYGNSDEIRNAADMVDSFERDLISMMSARTCKETDDIKSSYFDGTDHWMSVEDAKSLRLVDEIIDTESQIQVPEAFNSAHDARMYYASIISNNHKNSKTMPLDIKKLAQAIGLSDDAGEDAVIARISDIRKEKESMVKIIEDLKAENKKLSDEAVSRAKKDIERMVQDAIDAKKITAEQKDVFTKLAMQDLESTKSVLDGMTGVEPIAKQLGKSQDEDNRAWDELFKSGELEKVKNNNPERYAKLYKEKFGREPQNQ